MNKLTSQYRQTGTHFFFWSTIYSQWHTTDNQIVENDIVYPNAESYMMIKKAELFGDDKILEQMLESENPKDVKALGRKVSNFDNDIWNENRIDIVSQANYLKFSQNEKFLNFMMKHKDLILVEASPVDKIWGIGIHFSEDEVVDKSNWKGKNLLGVCLMNARKRILNDIDEIAIF